MWLEGLAGLFGGASQGMNNIQDQRQKQAQLKIQQDQAKRQAVAEANDQLYRSYQSTPEGSEVDPATAAQWKAAGLGGLTADGGKIIKAKSPQTQMLELTYQTAQEEAAERQRKRAVLDQVHNEGSGFFQRPRAERIALAIANGMDEKSVLLPEEELEFNPTFQGAQVAAQSRLGAAGIAAASRASAGQVTPAVRARLDQQMYDTAVRAATAKSKDVMGNVDPVKYEANLSAELVRAKQGVSGVQGAPAPAVSGQPVQVGKYKVQY